MGLKKFFGAEDAARFAASLTEEWQNEEGEIWDRNTLIGVANCADGENPLDEEDEDICYVVDENGAVGYTEDGGGEIDWWVTPTRVTVNAAPPAARFCPECGTQVGDDWAFCEKCGRRLR